jgi:hypothetical protein
MSMDTACSQADLLGSWTCKPSRFAVDPEGPGGNPGKLSRCALGLFAQRTLPFWLGGGRKIGDGSLPCWLAPLRSSQIIGFKCTLLVEPPKTTPSTARRWDNQPAYPHSSQPAERGCMHGGHSAKPDRVAHRWRALAVRDHNSRAGWSTAWHR